MDSIHQARLAQSVEHQTWNRMVVGSSPTVDKKFFILYFVASDALLAGRMAPCKWNQAWRPSELYMCIEREKVDFKSREVNCLKECALALTRLAIRLSSFNADKWFKLGTRVVDREVVETKTLFSQISVPFPYIFVFSVKVKGPKLYKTSVNSLIMYSIA